MLVKARADCDGITHKMKAGGTYDVTDHIGTVLIGRGLVDEASAIPATEGEVAEVETAEKRTPTKRKFKKISK